MKKTNLKKLYKLISDYNLDGYIVPKNDSFFTEQVKHDRLQLISNFSGSAGLAVILKKKNYLFVDSRYTIQAKLESGTNFKIIKIHEKLPKTDPMTLADPNMPWFSVKEAVMPFARFPGVDTILGPEMRSTGEVMGWDRNFARAFLKAQLGAGMNLPTSGKVFFSVKDNDKTPLLLETARLLTEIGFDLVATRGTAEFIQKDGINCDIVNKVHEGRPNIAERMKNNEISLVMNTTEGIQSIRDSRDIRSVALFDKIPYFTTAAAANAAASAAEHYIISCTTCLASCSI